MKILVVGSGGREHALAWKIFQSPQCEKLFCAPGNAGTSSIAKNVSIDPSDISKLLNFARREKIDLTVVGPELPLTLGIVDEFEENGLKIFGPRKSAAELEGSKIFAKQFMERHRIPSAKYEVAESDEEALQIINSGNFSFPLVVKADGLAAGKGVIICNTQKNAEEAVNSIMVEKKFGEAGDRIIVEEFLRGKEVSFIVITDGVKIAPLVTTMDHKAAYDGDKGPNTGGMGAISPSPFIDKELFSNIVESIVFPSVMRLLEEGRKYKGVLYVGLMLTDEGPKVLEYNCRFGDPETQPQMLRMKTDLVDVMNAAVEEKLLDTKLEWTQNPSGCVIIASGGYPGKYSTGKQIFGLSEAEELEDVILFHAGTVLEKRKIYTDGGRVLGVCSSKETLTQTMKTIYAAISRINFEAVHYRQDIGAIKEE